MLLLCLVTHTPPSRPFSLVSALFLIYNPSSPFPVAAAVGTVSVRSLIEPIRKVLARLRGHFVQARAVDLVMSERLLEIESTASDGTKTNIYLPYVV
jgi:hypothetical protein